MLTGPSWQVNIWTPALKTNPLISN